MLGEAHFRQMKKSAIFINTGRGATVNEEGLIKALQEGWIAHAALDVLEKEPPSHNNPMLRRATGQLERLDVGGIPLGMMEMVTYESATLTLNPADWLVIFTDGLVEAENARQEEYGEARLLIALEAGKSLDPPEMLKRLMAELDLFVGSTPQHDDVTCMLLKAQ